MSDYHNKLDQIISSSAKQIEGLDEMEFSLKSAPDKWSKKEILGHLIDSAYNNHQRFIRAEKQNDYNFQGYDQVEWVKRNNYQSQAKKEVLDTWIYVNKHMSFLIQSIPDHVLNRQIVDHNFNKICMTEFSENKPATLSYLIWDYLFHLEHHLSQIIPGYDKVNPDFN